MAASKLCFLLIMIQLIWLIFAQDQDKRIPQGFVGMRGKKLIDSTEIERYYKRKPQFFIGVKGKKNLLDTIDDTDGDLLNYKREPMGFVGMRGKKGYAASDLFPYSESHYYTPHAAGSLFGQIDYFTNDGHDSQEGFPFLNDLLRRYMPMLKQQALKYDEAGATLDQPDKQLSDENEADKRAASQYQFFGVRGKKSVQNKRPYDLTFRGKFIGVRGKKDIKHVGDQGARFLSGDDDGPLPKRKAQMGFFGMRGKKWSDESSPETVALD